MGKKSDWMPVNEDSPLEVNLDCGAQVKVWARCGDNGDCEVQAEIIEPKDGGQVLYL